MESQLKIKPVDELTFADNFMFCWIMQNDKDICKGVIERLLKVKVGDIGYPTVETAISPFYESKGVRLDVYVADSERVFDLEIQTYTMGDLPLRARYYQSMIDTDFLMKGNPYSALKESYIVFICLDDPIGRGLPLYKFRMVCEEDNGIVLPDKAFRVFANASAYNRAKDVELRSFLEYIKRKNATTEFTKGLDDTVARIKQINKFRSDYGSMNLHDQDILRIGREQGLTQGITETASRMLMSGIPIDMVASITQLPMDRIEQLRKSNNLTSSGATTGV